MKNTNHLQDLKCISETLDQAMKWFLAEDHSNNKDRNALYRFGILTEYISQRIHDLTPQEECLTEENEND
jgi:hypothetical protein